MNTKCFWLYSDGKTVRQIDREAAMKRARNGKKHIVYLHENGDLWTSDSYINHVQLKQVLDSKGTVQ